MENMEIRIIETINSTPIQKVGDYKAQFEEHMNSLIIDVTEDNVDEYKENAKALNKFADTMERRAIDWENQASATIKTYRGELNSFRDIARKKRLEIKAQTDIFDEQEKKQRQEIIRLEFEKLSTQRNLFDFNDFDHLKKFTGETFDKKGDLTKGGKPKKETNEKMLGYLNKFETDYTMINGNEMLYKFYIQHNYDLVKAKNECDEVNRLAAQKAEQELQEKIRREEREKLQREQAQKDAKRKEEERKVKEAEEQARIEQEQAEEVHVVNNTEQQKQADIPQARAFVKPTDDLVAFVTYVPKEKAQAYKNWCVKNNFKTEER